MRGARYDEVESRTELGGRVQQLTVDIADARGTNRPYSRFESECSGGHRRDIESTSLLDDFLTVATICILVVEAIGKQRSYRDSMSRLRQISLEGRPSTPEAPPESSGSGSPFLITIGERRKSFPLRPGAPTTVTSTTVSVQPAGCTAPVAWRAISPGASRVA
jgi:hypothetical protein